MSRSRAEILAEMSRTAAKRRRNAVGEKEAIERERELWIEGLRAGIQRKELLDRTSLSGREVSNLQKEHGLRRADRKTATQ